MFASLTRSSIFGPGSSAAGERKSTPCRFMAEVFAGKTVLAVRSSATSTGIGWNSGSIDTAPLAVSDATTALVVPLQPSRFISQPPDEAGCSLNVLPISMPRHDARPDAVGSTAELSSASPFETFKLACLRFGIRIDSPRRDSPEEISPNDTRKTGEFIPDDAVEVPLDDSLKSLIISPFVCTILRRLAVWNGLRA